MSQIAQKRRNIYSVLSFCQLKNGSYQNFLKGMLLNFVHSYMLMCFFLKFRTSISHFEWAFVNLIPEKIKGRTREKSPSPNLAPLYHILALPVPPLIFSENHYMIVYFKLRFLLQTYQREHVKYKFLHFLHAKSLANNFWTAKFSNFTRIVRNWKRAQFLI